eukprot:GHVU01170758.1.p1 GENE.GHVU01170758.1~~GHVU01170758.1.p1  ORF type:complete len:292 (-),score=42.83 GHVU01170758.1:512-1387(-)
MLQFHRSCVKGSAQLLPVVVPRVPLRVFTSVSATHEHSPPASAFASSSSYLSFSDFSKARDRWAVAAAVAVGVCGAAAVCGGAPAQRPAKCDSSNKASPQHRQLFSWGNGSQGQLGQGDLVSKTLPDRIQASRLDPTDFFMRCACGRMYSACLTAKGKLFTWGGSRNGNLGREEVSSAVCQPELVETVPTPIVQLACGEAHMLVVTSEGRVYSWGDNIYGECGRAQTATDSRTTDDSWSRRSQVSSLLPGQVEALRDVSVVSVRVFGLLADRINLCRPIMTQSLPGSLTHA